MKTRKQDFVLGLVALGLLALFVGTIFFLSPGAGYSTQRFVVHFKHEDGVAPLKPGSPVVLGGSIQVGKVTSIETRDVPVPGTQGRARELMIVVECDVNESLTLFSDCVVTTDQPAVGGGGTVVILDVGTPPELYKPTKPVIGLPPQSLAAAISTLSRRLLSPDGMVAHLEYMVDPKAEGSLFYKLLASVSDLNAITVELRAQTNPQDTATLMRKIHQMADDLTAVTASIRAQTSVDDGQSLMAKVHGLLAQLATVLTEVTALASENRAGIRDTIAHLEHATRTIDEQMVMALKTEFERDNPASLLHKIHLAMDSVNTSLEDVQTLTDSGKRLLVLNRPSLDRTFGNLKDMSEQLRLTSNEVRLAPWKLLYKPTPRESDEMSVFEAARTFAEAATFLDDATARLEAVVASAPPGQKSLEADEELKAIKQSLRSAFDRFQKAEQFLYDKMK